VRVAGYLERHGTPASLAELARHRCIIHRQNDDAYGIWRFLHQDDTEVVKVHGMLSSNDGDIVLGWALDGHGILIRSEWDLAKYLDSGRLPEFTLVLPEFTLPAADLFVYYPSQSEPDGPGARLHRFSWRRAFQAPQTPISTRPPTTTSTNANT
jgi:LysR family transcriptional activator of dmlA